MEIIISVLAGPIIYFVVTRLLYAVFVGAIMQKSMNDGVGGGSDDIPFGLFLVPVVGEFAIALATLGLICLVIWLVFDKFAALCKRTSIATGEKLERRREIKRLRKEAVEKEASTPEQLKGAVSLSDKLHGTLSFIRDNK